jgi:hypothetical protein
MSIDVNQKYCQSCHLISRNSFIITKITNNELTDMLLMYMGNVITLSECSCGVQRVRRAISKKTPSWTTSVINLVQRRNRQDRTQICRKQ